MYTSAPLAHAYTPKILDTTSKECNYYTLLRYEKTISIIYIFGLQLTKFQSHACVMQYYIEEGYHLYFAIQKYLRMDFEYSKLADTSSNHT